MMPKRSVAPPTLAECIAAVPGFDAEDLPVATARSVIAAMITPLERTEIIDLRSALGRILAGDIVSPIDVPNHANSAMDGYALRGEDLQNQSVQLAIVGIATAGHPFSGLVQRGQCLRIMTGALLPPSCDTVIPQEHCQDVDARQITVPAGSVRAGENCRLAGEDLPFGEIALRRGRILRAAELGLIASLGIGTVTVQQRLRVAFFSTGDELRPIGTSLDSGCVHDSNRYTLFGMLSALGCEVVDLGLVADDPAALESALRQGCEQADVIITSGGVSQGAADFTRHVMANLGEVASWRLAMRPGRPLAFGRINANGHSALLFGLPGNPVAVMISFYFFARQALLQLSGADATLPPLMRAVCTESIPKKRGRTEYQRGIVTTEGDGPPRVGTTGKQGSGILHSMTRANCIIVLHHDQASVQAGDHVDILLFDGLM